MVSDESASAYCADKLSLVCGSMKLLVMCSVGITQDVVLRCTHVSCALLYPQAGACLSRSQPIRAFVLISKYMNGQPIVRVRFVHIGPQGIAKEAESGKPKRSSPWMPVLPF